MGRQKRNSGPVNADDGILGISLIAFGIAGGSKPQQLPKKGFDMETKLASPKKLAVAEYAGFPLHAIHDRKFDCGGG